MHGVGVEGVARVSDGGGEGEGSVVVYEDRKGERREGRRRLDGRDGINDGGRKGKVEGVAGETATLIEGIGLEVTVEGGPGLDEGWARNGVEEEEEGVGGCGVRMGGWGLGMGAGGNDSLSLSLSLSLKGKDCLRTFRFGV